MTNIESLLKEALLLLQRPNRRLSVRLGRAQLAQLMKQLSGEVEKSQAGLGPNGN